LTKPESRAQRKSKRIVKNKQTIGWREWVDLPDLGVERIKAKIDTGARTSALHAFHVTPEEIDGVLHVKFGVHPVQKRRRPEIQCIAPVLEQREITSSNGQKSIRYVIETTLLLGGRRWPIELTLTNRDEMGFRMLIGRQAVRKYFLVEPGRAFLMNRRPKRRRESK